MGVERRHPDYLDNFSIWKKCRDAATGEEAIKAAGELYLPKASTKQDSSEYAMYKQRAAFFNATGRTVDGYEGLIFRKPPIISHQNDAIQSYLDDITLTGISLQEFCQHSVREVITTGRGGILVDYQKTENFNQQLSRREIEQFGFRPYFSFYQAESITNWSTGSINSKWVLVRVVLKESYPINNADDEFAYCEGDQYRVLDFDEKGYYRQRVFRKVDDDWIVTATVQPIMNNQPMKEIPFFFLSTVNSTPEVCKPIILDLVNTNLSYYKNSADFENGLHFTGTPTPVFIGDFALNSNNDEEEEVVEIRLGSSSGIHLQNGGDAKYLEYSGGGLSSLKEAMEAKKQEMALLGAKIIANQKKDAETAETARIQKAGESSILASLANSISKTVTKAVNFMLLWANIQEQITVTLNTDYMPDAMTAQDLTALVQSWQSGAITEQELFWNLQRGEIIPAEKSFEDHKEELEAAGPPLGSLGLSYPAAGREADSDDGE